MTTWACATTFRTTTITAIPVDLFRYNTLVTQYAFRDTFQACVELLSIPTDIFRYNTLLSIHAFEGTFIGCIKVTTLPVDLFRYNINVSEGGFFATFTGCSGLETVPVNLFKYNVLAGLDAFKETFKDCIKLQLNRNIFYADGEQATRFTGAPIAFMRCFQRTSFTGTQGEAPDLWNCELPVMFDISNRPAIAWVAGDVITGQTSGVTSVFLAFVSTFRIIVKDLSGVYTSGEVIGVTGVPNKLADQAAGYPIQYDPDVTDCFDGAGNSVTSISNYGDIPAEWT